jgi:small conductance mechanosensitive channel
MKHAFLVLFIVAVLSVGGILRAAAEDSEESALKVSEVAAKYIMRLESTIAEEEQQHTELKRELASRKRAYEKVAALAKELQRELEKNQSRLTELDAAKEPEKARNLEQQTSQMTNELELVNEQLALAFQLHKNAIEQSQTLQLKLKKDREALVMVKSGTAAQPAPEKIALPALQRQQPTAESPTGTPMVVPLPGMVPPTTEPQSLLKDDEMRPETAEQIGARIDAARQEAKVERIAAFQVDFARRKELLEHQIKLAETAQKNGKEALANLEALLALRQQALTDNTAAGADATTVQQLQKEVRETEASLKSKQRRLEERTTRLGELREQLDAVSEEQRQIAQIANKVREDAAAAQEESVWLRSAYHPKNIQHWAEEHGPGMLMVLGAVVALLLLLRLTVRGLARMIVGRVPGLDRLTTTNRADTLALSFRSAGSGLILILGLLMLLEAAGVNVATLLGGAAIFGVALAFGAQHLMRDYLNGFIILLEDQYRINDVLTIDKMTGVVESVNMRATVLRDLEGRAHFIPNGQVKAITNHTYRWSRAVFDIPVAYKEDMDRVMSVLVEVGHELRIDPVWRQRVIDEPVMLGVDAFKDSAVIVKFMMKTRADQKWDVKREMLRRIKKRFDEIGIEIPLPHRVIFERKEESLPPSS